jgi:hypothetical protein
MSRVVRMRPIERPAGPALFAAAQHRARCGAAAMAALRPAAMAALRGMAHEATF